MKTLQRELHDYIPEIRNWKWLKPSTQKTNE